MKILKLYETKNLPYEMVIKTLDGEYKKFYIIPIRKIEDKDLTNVFYVDKGNNSKEAISYMYELYGFEKVENN